MSAARKPPEPPDDGLTGEECADQLSKLLRECAVVRVHARTKTPGVKLPAHLTAGDSVALDIGLNASPPIPDLWVDGEGIRATLSFRQSGPFYVVIPWAAVLLIHPPEVPVPVLDAPKKPVRRLGLVPKDLPYDARFQDAALVPDTNPRLPARLRLVKE